MQNKGNKPSLITRIDADIVYFQQLTDCTGEASTPNALAVKYQLAIPMNGAEPAESTFQRGPFRGERWCRRPDGAESRTTDSTGVRDQTDGDVREDQIDP